MVAGRELPGGPGTVDKPTIPRTVLNKDVAVLGT